MASDFDLTGRVRIDTTEIENLASNMSGQFKKVAGVVAGAFALDRVKDFAVGAATQFAGFEASMNEVFTLLPGITSDAMGQMTGQVKGFAKEFAVLPEAVVPALYQSLSAGVPKDNVFEFLSTAQKAAKGGVTDLETAVDGISSTVNAYGKDIISATQASDLMFTAVRFGKTTFADLSKSLFQVNPIAAALGVKFGDVTAALAAMTSQGIPTSVATTQLRQMFVELSQDGGKLATTFEKVSGKSFKDFIASGKNVQDALMLLEKHAKGSGVGVNDLFGSVEAGSAALALSGKGTAAFGTAIEEMGKSAGATEGAFNTMNTGLQRVIDDVKVSADLFKLSVGGAIGAVYAAVADRNWPALGAKLGGIFGYKPDSAATGAITTAITGIVTAVEESVSTARQRLESMLVGLKLDAGQFAEAVRAAVASGDWNPVGVAVGEKISGAVRGAVQLGGVLGERLLEAVRTIPWGEIAYEFGRQAPTLLLGLATGLANFDVMPIFAFIGDHWLEILLGIVSLAFIPARVIGPIANMLGKIPLAGPFITWAVNGLKTLADEFVAGAAAALGALGRGFLDGLGFIAPQVTGRLRSFLDTFVITIYVKAADAVAAVRAFVGGLPGALLNGLEAVGRAAGRIAGAVTEALTGFNVGQIVRAGADLIEGLIRGIRDNAGRLIGAIKQFVTDRLPQFVKDALGIRSPSRVFAALGREIPAGMALGITQGADAVTAAMGALTQVPSLTAGGYGVATGAVGGALSGGSSITVGDIHLYGVQDGPGVERAIPQLIDAIRAGVR